MFTIPVFVQLVMGYSAISTGIALLPLSIFMFIFSMLGNRMQKILSPKKAIQLGIILTILGVLLLWQQISLEMSLVNFAPGLAFYGTGLGIIFSQITNLTMSGATPKQYSEASGFFNSQKQYAYSLGTALVGIVLILGIIGGITNIIYDSGIAPDVPKSELREMVVEWMKKIKQGELEIPPQYQPVVNEIVNQASVHAMKSVMMFMVIILIVALIISIWLPQNSLS